MLSTLRISSMLGSKYESNLLVANKVDEVKIINAFSFYSVVANHLFQ